MCGVNLCNSLWKNAVRAQFVTIMSQALETDEDCVHEWQLHRNLISGPNKYEAVPLHLQFWCILSLLSLNNGQYQTGCSEGSDEALIFWALSYTQIKVG